jgi:hypothetical protein
MEAGGMSTEFEQHCENCLRFMANSESDDLETEVIRWAVGEIDHLRAELAKIRKELTEIIEEAGGAEP